MRVYAFKSEPELREAAWDASNCFIVSIKSMMYDRFGSFSLGNTFLYPLDEIRARFL